MYNFILHAHSGLRWIVLAFLVFSVLKSLAGAAGKKEFQKIDQLSAMLSLRFIHLQFLLGLILYFISPQVQFAEGMMESSVLRFYTVEHITMMIIAVGVISVGHKKLKQAEDGFSKHKKVALFYGITLLIILAAIPWPFRELGAGWI